MRLGFVGTGALTAAIVTGLKSPPGLDASIVLSPRNADIAAGLAGRFEGVRVAPDNQAVLDACDTVMIAVRPQIAREVLSQLRFRPDHDVVSLVATIPAGVIERLVSPAPRVTRALPMPMAARRQGATIICPAHQDVAAIFARVGAAIAVDDPAEFDALGVVTATFASYFRYLETIHQWLGGRGVDADKARDYIVAIYKALANAPDTMPTADFREMAADYATLGGLNEQVVRELADRKVFDAFAESLDSVHQRIVGS